MQMQMFPILDLCKDDNSFQINLQIQYNLNEKSNRGFFFFIVDVVLSCFENCADCQVF